MQYRFAVNFGTLSSLPRDSDQTPYGYPVVVEIKYCALLPVEQYNTVRHLKQKVNIREPVSITVLIARLP